MLRIGILGLGTGERHIEAFEAHPGCRVTVLSDVDEDKLRQVGERHPCKRLEDKPDKLLADPDLDLISIATPDNLHFQQATAALKHGRHVFVEKPLCLTAEESHALRQTLTENPLLHLSSNLPLRVSSRFAKLKRSLDAGEFGEVYYLEGDYLYGRLEKLTDGWRGRIPYYSVMLGGGLHLVDLVLWLTGDRVEEVTTYGNRISTRGTAFVHPDFAVSLLRFASGAIAKISANFGCRRPHFHGLEVHGTRKLFVNHPEHGTVYGSTAKKDEPALEETPYRDYRKPDLFTSFIDQVLGRGSALVSQDEVFRAMDVCLAMEQSLLQEKPVTLN